MAEPRKVFRIEQTAAARLAHWADARDSSHEPALLPHETMGDGHAIALGGPPLHLTRIAHELDAVTEGTAHATQKILAAAEEIEQLADNLAAALRGRTEQGQAQDIAELIVRIFEACNFQDLIGQRVSKALRMLQGDAADAHAPHLHGPRLDGDEDHMTQAEIDELFGG